MGWLAMSSYIAVAEPVTVRLLATSDVHGHFTGFNYFTQQPEQKGLVHTAAIIAKSRRGADISILIENGDLIQGSPVTDAMVAAAEQQQPLPLAALLNTLNYDVINLGNHEFDYGLDYLATVYAGVTAPILAANVKPVSAEAQQWLTHHPYVILERELPQHAQQAGRSHLKIAFIGVLPPQIMQWNGHHLRDHIVVIPMLDAVQQTIAELQMHQPDLTVLVAHAGMPKHNSNGNDAEQAVWELAQVAGIDAIIFGHQHELFPGTSVYEQLPGVDAKQGTLFGIPAVQPGVHGEHLGVIDFELVYSDEIQQWQVQRSNSAVVSISADRDQQLVELLQPTHKRTLAYMEQTIGYTQAELSHQWSRLQPTLATQLIHDAQLWYIERYVAQQQPDWGQLPRLSAVAPFHAANHADDSFTVIPAGALTMGDIGDLYRYANNLDVVVVTGEMLQQWLEDAAIGVQAGQPEHPWSWVNQDHPAYQFDTFSGLDYVIDPRKPVGARVSTRPRLNPTQHYAVITNNYRSHGGGKLGGLNGQQIVFSSPDQIQHILLEYIKTLGAEGYQNSLRNNWEIKR